MLYRMWKLKKKKQTTNKTSIKEWSKGCSVLLWKVSPCRKACPESGTQLFQRVTVSNSRAEDENLSKPLQLSLIPLRWRSLARERNNNMSRWRRSERMLHSEQNFTGPPCIMSPVHPPPTAPPPGSWVPIWNELTCWIILCAGIFHLHRAADITSLQYEALFIINYCITLTLVTITKLCFKQGGRYRREI